MIGLVQGPVVGIGVVIWRADEDRQMLGLLGDERDKLGAGRSGADDADALAGELRLFPRP